MSTKKASKKNSAARIGTGVQAAATARPTQELPAAVLGSAWIAGISLEEGGSQANIAVRLDIPPPTMKENPKWPFTKWYVDNLTKQLQKDLRRVAQTISNSAYVRGLVESRAAAKAASKPVPAAVVAKSQPEGERPTVGQ
jgi:hypothetical protein